MNFSIQSAKTIDEAVEKALKELKASRDEVDVEIVEEPSGGFFGPDRRERRYRQSKEVR